MQYGKNKQFFFGLLAVNIIFLGGSDQAIRRRSKNKIMFCKIDVLLHCFVEPMYAFTHTPTGTGFPLNSTEYDQWCL